jgi:hypothetical protein
MNSQSWESTGIAGNSKDGKPEDERSEKGVEEFWMYAPVRLPTR